MDDLILKYVLYNSVKYDKIDVNSILGKIIGERPELKRDIKEVIKRIKEKIKEVNKLSLEERKEKLEGYNFEKKREIKKELELSGIKEKVVMRFAPNPNGAINIGHARQVILNSYFCEKYNGDFILRFDDTDAKIKIPDKNVYKWIEEDLKWLGVKIKKVVRQSSRFDIYYKYAEELIKKNYAYVCNCKDFKKYVDRRKECPCRNEKDQLKKWKLMFTKYKEGDAVLRIKTNINDKNPAVIDWPAFRIINNGKHPFKKAKVWPLLNFASAIDDHEFKITHIVRGIDLKISDERQGYIYKYLGWKYPETIYTGRLLFKGLKSTSEIKKLIQERKINGWDDLKLVTLKTLRRRGFKPEAIKNFILSLGLNKNEVNVDMGKVEAFNREIIDKECNRFFVIFDPKKIRINSPDMNIKIPLHPEFERGFRILKTKQEFYVQDDIEKDKLYRFMHLFNFKNNLYLGKELDKSAKLIHWLPVSKELVDVEVMMDDGNVKKGFGESGLKNVKVNQVIQAERNFFMKLEKKQKDKLTFVYTHR